MNSGSKGHQYEDFYNEIKKRNQPEQVESDSDSVGQDDMAEIDENESLPSEEDMDDEYYEEMGVVDDPDMYG